MDTVQRSHVAQLLANFQNGSIAVSTLGSPTVLSLSDQSESDREKKIVALFDELSPSLLSYLSGLGLSVHDAEDITQEVFLRLVDHLLKNKREDNLAGWLFRVAHNLAMDIHRGFSKSGTRQDVEDDLETYDKADPALNPEQVFLEAEKMKRLSDAIDKLTPQQRNAILLRAEGLGLKDIAMVLGTHTSRAAQLIQRSLARLAAFCE